MYKEYYGSGAIKQEIPHVRNKRHGLAKWYDEDGKLSGTIYYDMGNKPKLAKVESVDTDTGIKTASVKNPDGSKTITKTDKNGKVISREVTSKKTQFASVTDPETGITTTSTRDSDGFRTVTKTDKNGKVISEETFPPKGKGLIEGTLPPPARQPARLDPNKTLPPPARQPQTANIPTRADPVGKNSIMPKGKVGGMPNKNVGGMPQGKVGGLRELSKGYPRGMPQGKAGGMAELSKGHPRGMPDGKVGGLLDRSILKGKAGKPVTDPRPFGMLPKVMKSIQKEVNQAGLGVRIRAANDSAIAKLRAGNPPKHVKLKSKTINDLDVQLGAPPGSQGEVGYFKPKKPKELEIPKEPINLNKAQLDRHRERVSELTRQHKKLQKRYQQRLQEYHDNAADIGKLIDQGLVSVENGVVIDRGLSNTRLGKDGKLVFDRNGPEGGTGKGFTGDHDMWDTTHADGRPIITDPKAPGFDANALQRKQDLQQALDKGLAQTQHGPHKDWTPISQRDIGIDKKIRSSHNPGGEALLEFTPNQPPRTSYEIDEAGKVILDKVVKQ